MKLDRIPTDRFRLLFEHSSEPHLIMVGDRLTDCHDAALKILGSSCMNDFLKLHPAQLSPPVQPDGRSSMEKAVEMDRLARENGYHRFEWVHRNLRGEDFPVIVTLNALTIDNQPAMIAVWHDL